MKKLITDARRCSIFQIIAATGILIGAVSSSVLAQSSPGASGAPGGLPGPGPGMGFGPPNRAPDLNLKGEAMVLLANGVREYRDLTYGMLPGYRPLTLDLYLPPARSGSAKFPAVVWVHGGAWLFGAPRMNFPSFGSSEKMLADLSAHGYVVAAVAYRLSGEARFPAQIEDVKAAIRWLRLNADKVDTDSQHLGIWGESAGAQLAALAGTSCEARNLDGPLNSPGATSSCVQAVVDWYGPTDFSQMDAQNPPGGMKHNAADSAESKYLGCALSDCPPAVISAANPISYIHSDAPPFLIMHGDSDVAVPTKQSQLLYDALRAKGVPVELKLVPHANHIFMGASAADIAKLLPTVEQFFDHTLRGDRAQ